MENVSTSTSPTPMPSVTKAMSFVPWLPYPLTNSKIWTNNVHILYNCEVGVACDLHGFGQSGLYMWGSNTITVCCNYETAVDCFHCCTLPPGWWRSLHFPLKPAKSPWHEMNLNNGLSYCITKRDRRAKRAHKQGKRGIIADLISWNWLHGIACGQPWQPNIKITVTSSLSSLANALCWEI